MHVCRTLTDLETTLNVFRERGNLIGLVPTMGALHKGHDRLIDRSKSENEITIVSIFVNPIQFNNQEDLINYPRDLEVDLKRLDELGVEVVFAPGEEVLYPSSPLISINFGKLATVLEGKFREGHFEGVGIIVSKLLNIIQPSLAYFGLKDLQQFLLIKRMCFDLNFPTTIVGVETIREKSGLALSSRNKRLSTKGLLDASHLYKGLKIVSEGILNGLPLDGLIKEARTYYEKSKNVLDIEYLEVINTSNLDPINAYDNLEELAICVAGYVEGIRLIDNIYLRLKIAQ